MFLGARAKSAVALDVDAYSSFVDVGTYQEIVSYITCEESMNGCVHAKLP